MVQKTNRGSIPVVTVGLASRMRCSVKQPLHNASVLEQTKRQFGAYPYLAGREDEREGFPLWIVWDDSRETTLVMACVSVDRAMPKVGADLCYRAALVAEQVAAEMRIAEGESPGVVSKVVIEVRDQV